MIKRMSHYFLCSLLIITSLLFFSGCNNDSTKDVSSNIEGEWTYTDGLAEIEFDKDGNAAVITPADSDTTETKQYTYKIDDDQITLMAKDTDEVVMESRIEIKEEDGKEYLTLSDLHTSDGTAINPTTATFEKLGDSTSAIE